MTLWQYLILANIYLALFYGFYALLLRKETFFQLNRLYLVASALLSFVMPAIQADWVQQLFITQQVKYAIYNSPVIIYQSSVQAAPGISIGQLLIYLYIGGLVLVGARFLWQIMRLRNLMRKKTDGAFAFFNKVNVHGELSEHDVVSAHEDVHVRQWHSADVMLMELISIVAWFNPVTYLYRNSIKHIHEFIADKQVIDAGADKAGYAMLLLTQTLNAPAHNMVTPFFNHSLLKQRIIMLQKSRSARAKLFKYGLSAPLFALMLVLSSATINNSKAINRITLKANDVLEIPVNKALNNTAATIGLRIDSIQPQAATKKTGPIIIVEPKVIKTQPEEVTIDTASAGNNVVFTAVEKQPEPQDGFTGLSKFIADNIRYPKEDREANRQGRVFVQFVIETNGALSHVKIIRGISPTIDAEALRVIKIVPKWKPGMQNGTPVRTQFTLPLAFTLNTNDAKPAEEKTINSAPTTPADTTIKSVRLIRGSNRSTGIETVTITGRPAVDSTSATIYRLTGTTQKPLYYLDGKEITAQKMEAISPASIKSIDVIKDKDAVSLYGQKGKDGVILIYTK